jgi:hypothetical protein
MHRTVAERSLADQLFRACVALAKCHGSSKAVEAVSMCGGRPGGVCSCADLVAEDGHGSDLTTLSGRKDTRSCRLL